MWCCPNFVFNVLNQIRRHFSAMNAVFEEVAKRLFMVQCFSNGRTLVHVAAKRRSFKLRHSAVQVQINTLKNVFVRMLNLSHWLMT